MYQQVKSHMTGEMVCVKRLSDNAFVPFDPANVDYQAYLKWLEEGNTPIGADTPIPSDSVADDNN